MSSDPEGRDYPGQSPDAVRRLSAVLATECPRTNFILAHWGGLLPLREPGVVALENIYYDTAASPAALRCDIWRRFLAVVDAKRLLFGSDYPLNLYPALETKPEMARLVAEAKRADLSPDRLRNILGEISTPCWRAENSTADPT